MASVAGVERILVVDDDASVCRAIARLLRSFGFEVDTYLSGDALLAARPGADVVCLVADVRMPGMTGPELVDELAASGHALPTVFVTAHGTGDLGSLHGARILLKPVGSEQLLEAIRDVRRQPALAVR